MCDYSLMHVKSRPAAVGDKLRTTGFNSGTRGFTSPDDASTAVCLLPGTEVAFDAPAKVCTDDKELGAVAIFRQLNKDKPYTHHDALEFASGEIKLLTSMVEGQTCTVLQLPAQPKNEAEAEEQKRAEVVA